MKKFVLSLSALSLFVSPLALAQTVFIKDAKVVTNTNQGTIENANIVIRNGRIMQIGPDAPEPANADVVGGEDIWVTSGLFAVQSTIGIVEIGAEDSANDTRAGDSETSVSDMYSDSFNPQSPGVDIARIEGVTHAAISGYAGHNIFAGTGFIADTSGEFSSVIDDSAFVYAQLGSSGANTAGGSRSAAMSQLRAALDDAGAYPSRFDGPEDGDTLSRRDASALAAAARGAMPLVIGADRASDLLKIIELKADYGGLDIIVSGAAESWMVADELAEAGVKVIIDPHDNLPGSFDRVGARLDNAKLLSDAGVEFAITSGYTNLLPQHAGNAVTNGLEWDAAFAAISSVPASWFDVNLGDVRQGETATLVVWDGDPLEVTSSPRMLMIDGEVQSLESRQTELRDRYNPTRDETKPFKYR